MFGSKSKGLFVDLAGDFALAARTSGVKAPFTIEEFREIPIGEPAAVADALRSLAGVRGNGYVTARCSIYPHNRIVARIPVEGRKLRDEGYLSSHAAETLKIDPNQYHMFALSPFDGAETGSTRTPPKEVLLCGAMAEEINQYQTRLLDLGVYPDRIEIGTISSLGGIKSYLGFSDPKTPTLLLEIGSETTNIFVVTGDSVEITRSVAFGIASMVPLVQKELALKDLESARKLFFSNSFDFTGMGPQLTKRLLRELQASIGFYEVQTGQSISQLCCTLLPAKVTWLQKTMADVLGMKVVNLDYVSWLKSIGIEFADSSQAADLPPIWTSLFCLMGEYRGRNDEIAA